MVQQHEQLEKSLSEHYGLPFVVGCSSGTAALHLALEALKLPLGSEVIVPDYAMIAAARAVVMAGHVPVFVDCDENLNLDPELVLEALSEKTRALIAVHNYGRECNMETLHYVAGYNSHQPLFVLEDSAEAHCSPMHPKSMAVCWSFYKNKVIAGEEGGAVGTNSKILAENMRELRCLGFTAEHDYTHSPRGHNYRLSNVHASLIKYSLRNVERNRTYRNNVIQQLDFICPERWRLPDNRKTPWVYDFRIPGLFKGQQKIVVDCMRGFGLEVRYGFKSLSGQEEFKNCRYVSKDQHSKRLSTEVIYLTLRGNDIPEKFKRFLDSFAPTPSLQEVYLGEPQEQKSSVLALPSLSAPSEQQ